MANKWSVNTTSPAKEVDKLGLVGYRGERPTSCAECIKRGMSTEVIPGIGENGADKKISCEARGKLFFAVFEVETKSRKKSAKSGIKGKADFTDENDVHLISDLVNGEGEPIGSMFLLEVPNDMDHTIFYNILDHFASIKVAPMYSVVRNPNIDKPFVTVSQLYSRKPMDLVNDFNRISEESTKAKIEKSLEQYVQFETMEVNFKEEAKKVADEKGQNQDEILSVLKRLGKLK